MLPYYNKVELLAGNIAPSYFKGTFKYSKDTYCQESFDFKLNNIRYLCYVDIYNEQDDHFNIIEAKATTSSKYLSLGKKKDDILIPIFQKGADNIYYLLEDLNIKITDFMSLDDYNKQKRKLFDRFNSAGHYIYDLAIQRYIIENDLKQNHEEEKAKQIKYYLAVLNHQYVFDGKYENGIPVYDTSPSGEDIICYFDFTKVTQDYMDIIDIERKKIEEYINKLDHTPYSLGIYCENKKTTVCKYKNVCFCLLGILS
jgi:hypothetical protein